MMPLETKDVAYPLPFAGHQLNSRVKAAARGSWGLSWRKGYAEVEPEFTGLPYAVQIKDDLIAVRSENDLFFYSAAGAFLRKRELGGGAPVVLGAGAYAYLHPSYEWTILDYRDEEVVEPGPLPRLGDWASAFLLKPTVTDVLAVVQFSGGPSHKPPRYHAYRFLLEDGAFDWHREFDGSVSAALLTGDGGRIVLLQPEKLQLVDTGSGDVTDLALPEIGRPLAACLDPADNLIVIGERASKPLPSRQVQAWSLDGGLLWSLPLRNPSLSQPPACGGEGRVYVVDGQQLFCLIGGQPAWSALLQPAEDTWITVTADDHALVLNGARLLQFDPDGKQLGELVLGDGAETFHAPPAVDDACRIFVAGSENLYCLE